MTLPLKRKPTLTDAINEFLQRLLAGVLAITVASILVGYAAAIVVTIYEWIR